MFWLGLSAGILASGITSLAIFFANRLLNKIEPGPMIENRGPRSTLRKTSGKRAPRVHTDLMEYQREIQMEGEHRV